MIRNATLRDSRLSFGARGLLAYLLSRPDDWQVRTQDLIQSPASRAAVHSILRELKAFAYLRRERTQGDGGKIAWETVVYEKPHLSREPCVGFPTTGEPSTADPSTVKRHTTKERRNERTKNENSSARPSGSQHARAEKSASALSRLSDEQRAVIEAWRELTRRYPAGQVWPYILERLTQGFDAERLRRCGVAYMANYGTGPQHVAGICDWYEQNRVMPERSGSGNAKPVSGQFGRPEITRDFSKFPRRAG